MGFVVVGGYGLNIFIWIGGLRIWLNEGYDLVWGFLYLV